MSSLPMFLEANAAKRVDVLYVLLVHSDRFSVLPELYEIFGREALLKFLDLFSGTTISVPSAEDLRSAIRDMTIYTRLVGATASSRSSRVERLADEYGVSKQTVEKRFDKVKEMMSAYDFRSVENGIRNGE